MVSLQASGFTATILGFIVLAVVVLAPSLKVLAEQQQQIAALEAELATVDAEVAELEEQRERWNDRAYVEAQARSRLMFVYPGDITYLVIDDVGIDEEDTLPTISTEVTAAETKWMESLFASYLVAATTKTPDFVEDEQPTPRLPSPEVDTTEEVEQ